MTVDPSSLVRLRRSIRGMSAILLPFTAAGRIDWEGFAAHVARTAAAGITPAVNMDTGFVQLIDDATREQALRLAREVVGDGELVAGACVVEAPGAAFDAAAYG
ncbi:MAG: dihydrodipicolinate synthase family protein, partial [Pirellulales bacterium]